MKKFVTTYITIVQKVLITVMLFLLYVFGFGLMALSRPILYRPQRPKHAGKGQWLTAEGYEDDLEESSRES